MKLDQDFIVRCTALHPRHDIALIASLLGAAQVDVSRALRQAGEIRDVKTPDVVFIVENYGRMPNRAIADHLKLTTSQLDQILRRSGLRKKQDTEVLTLDICIAKTRWLIEEKLKLPVNDLLPRKLSNWHFTENGLSAIMEFATLQKARSAPGKHSTACAYLVMKAYPGQFQIWQFSHAKAGSLFSGKNGKTEYLKAVLWLIWEKLEVKPEALPYLLHSHSFLSAQTLQDYGLASVWWKRFWSRKQDMLEAIAKAAKVSPVDHGDSKTVRLRARLQCAGIDPSCCAVPGCPVTGIQDIQVHHIVRRATRVAGKFDINAAANLVPLCRQHHGIADRLNIKFDRRNPETLRPTLLAALAKLNGASNS